MGQYNNTHQVARPDPNDKVEILDSNSQSVQNKKRRLQKYQDQIKDEPVEQNGKGAMDSDLDSNDIQSVIDALAADQSQSTMPPPVT